MLQFFIILSISLSFGLAVAMLQLHRYKTQRLYDSEEFDSFLTWIVNDAGELGVKIGNRCGFLYKGGTIEYGNDAEDIKKYREHYKREFGECCISPLYRDKIHQSNDEKNPWRKLPHKPQRIKSVKQ